MRRAATVATRFTTTVQTIGRVSGCRCVARGPAPAIFGPTEVQKQSRYAYNAGWYKKPDEGQVMSIDKANKFTDIETKQRQRKQA
jgi:hypothetical protein